MDSFRSYLFRKAYKEVEKLGDKLARIEPLIDWEAFRPVIQSLYDNKTPKGGRPNVDPVVMVKLLVLQQWYGLSDPELERQVDDRLSFQRFLGFPARARAQGLRCHHEAWGQGSPVGYTGQAAEQAYQPEAGSRGEAVRRNQAGVRLRSRSGDDVAPGSCEDGVRVFLLQLVSVGHLGGEVIA